MGKKKNLSFVLGTLFLDIVVIWIWHLFFNPPQPFETYEEAYDRVMKELKDYVEKSNLPSLEKTRRKEEN